MPPTPPSFHPSPQEKAKIYLSRNLTHMVGRGVQYLIQFVIGIFQFIVQMFRDAFGR